MKECYEHLRAADSSVGGEQGRALGQTATCPRWLMTSGGHPNIISELYLASKQLATQLQQGFGGENQ